MATVPIKPLSLLLASVLLGTALLGAGCITRLASKGDVPAGDIRPADSGEDSAYTEANLRPRAEQQLQAFIDALDRGDATAARALLSSQQRDPEFLSMMTPEQLHTVADWYRTYRFGALWGNRVEFRPTHATPQDIPASSLYIHFVPGEEGITY